MPRSAEPAASTTAAILREQYGPRVIIPLDRVMEDYFPGLSQEHLMRQGVPVVRVYDSPDALEGVPFADLAAYIDSQLDIPSQNESAEEDERGPFVYLIGFDNWVKIGYTAGSVKKRMRRIQTNIPIKLQFIRSMPGSYKLEAELHKRFAEYRRQGEWFVREGALAEWIKGGCRDTGGAS